MNERPHDAGAGAAVPLFVCHANCCRSVLACYLYRHLFPGAPALSAGLGAGDVINDRALAMLRLWGIDAAEHRPRQLDRALCDEATAIFVMGPSYLHRLVAEYGADLAEKCYLFADPFTRPAGLCRGEFKVRDPSFDSCPAEDLVSEFAWMRDRVAEVRQALAGEGRALVPASAYWELCRQVDPRSH